MKVIDVPDKGELVEFTIPDSFKEITLRQMCNYHQYTEELEEIDLKFADLRSDLEYRQMEVEMEGAELDVFELGDWEARECELLLEKSKAIRNQILSITPSSEHQKVNSLSHLALSVMRDMLMLPERQTADPIAEFYLPKGVIPDIQALEEKKQEFDPNVHIDEVAKIDVQINRIQEGKFLALPMAEVIFEAKLKVDKVLKTLPSMDESLLQVLEEKGMTLEQYVSESQDSMTPEELEEKIKHMQAIKTHWAMFKAKKVESAAALLSHVCVPDHTDYDYGLSEKRIPYFLDLDMHTVEGLLAFFLTTSMLSTTNTKNFFNRKGVGLISLNGLLSSKSYGGGGVLSDWFFDHLQENQKTNS